MPVSLEMCKMQEFQAIYIPIYFPNDEVPVVY